MRTDEHHPGQALPRRGQSRRATRPPREYPRRTTGPSPTVAMLRLRRHAGARGSTGSGAPPCPRRSGANTGLQSRGQRIKVRARPCESVQCDHPHPRSSPQILIATGSKPGPARVSQGDQACRLQETHVPAVRLETIGSREHDQQSTRHGSSVRCRGLIAAEVRAAATPAGCLR